LSRTIPEEQGNTVESIEDLLKKIVSRISEKMKPDKIILFGSYAWGKPNDTLFGCPAYSLCF
jgi:hypothetical protein